MALGFGSLGDRLAFVVDANVDGFVRGMQKAGTTADRELAKTQGGLDKTNAMLKSVGIGMIAAGTVALVGLGKMASAANEAELANTKLANSVANNPKTAGASTKAYEDLANALQKKTVADDESIKSGEAVLLQFGATKDQVLALTPLVVDLSRKMGIDMETAAKTVGKALDGNSGALARVGIQVDKTAYATDHYKAVQEALNKAVGGFAEAEGKTFAGQIGILKNELQELEEAVGVGVVHAFGNMLHGVTAVADVLDRVSPGTKQATGEWLTYAAAATIAVGAILRIKAAWSQLPSAAGPVGVAIAALTAAWTLHNNAVHSSENALVQALAGMDVPGLLDEWNSGFLKSKEVLELVAKSNLGVIIQLRDALKGQGEDVTVLNGIIDEHVKQQRSSAEAAKLAADATDGVTQSDKELTDATQRLIDKVKAQADAYQAALDQVHGITDANIAFSNAQQQVIQDVNEAIKTTDDHTTAQDESVIAINTAKSSILNYGQAAVDQYAQVAGGAATAQGKHDAERKALGDLAATLAPGSQLRVWLEQYIASLDAIKPRYDTIINIQAQIGGHPITGGGGSGIVLYASPGGIGGQTKTARGYDGWVAPRAGGKLFQVAEAGEPEHVKITPASQMRRGMGPDGEGGGATVNIYQTFGPIYGDDRKVLEAANRGARDAVNASDLRRLIMGSS